jgi:hypothetical protein
MAIILIYSHAEPSNWLVHEAVLESQEIQEQGKRTSVAATTAVAWIRAYVSGVRAVPPDACRTMTSITI